MSHTAQPTKPYRTIRTPACLTAGAWRLYRRQFCPCRLRRRRAVSRARCRLRDVHDNKLYSNFARCCARVAAYVRSRTKISHCILHPSTVPLASLSSSQSRSLWRPPRCVTVDAHACLRSPEWLISAMVCSPNPSVHRIASHRASCVMCVYVVWLSCGFTTAILLLYLHANALS